jgi:hypothetical protein
VMQKERKKKNLIKKRNPKEERTKKTTPQPYPQPWHPLSYCLSMHLATLVDLLPLSYFVGHHIPWLILVQHVSKFPTLFFFW